MNEAEQMHEATDELVRAYKRYLYAVNERMLAHEKKLEMLWDIDTAILESKNSRA